MKGKELQQRIITSMENWQKVEGYSIASTAQIVVKTKNPIIKMVMEIIQRDSQMHSLVQNWIAETLAYKTVSLSPDELLEVGQMIEQHIAIENEMVESAEQAIESVKDKKAMLAQQYFLNYLLNDEKKHSNLLSSLDILAKGMQP
ncbi:hypothetical protein ACFLUS_05815 [Chloroflexota bacterium]